MNILIGFITGLIASMGLGGGFVLIIYLTFFMGMSQSEAQGVNLLFFLPIALFSTFIHGKNRLIKWKLLPYAVISGIIGAAAGSFLSLFMGDEILRRLFGGLIIIIGIKEVFHKKKEKQRTVKDTL